MGGDQVDRFHVPELHFVPEQVAVEQLPDVFLLIVAIQIRFATARTQPHSPKTPSTGISSECWPVPCSRAFPLVPWRALHRNQGFELRARSTASNLGDEVVQTSVVCGCHDVSELSLDTRNKFESPVQSLLLGAVAVKKRS